MVLLKGKLHAGEGIKLPREVLESSGLRDGDVDLMSGLSPVRRRYDEAMSSLVRRGLTPIGDGGS